MTPQEFKAWFDGYTESIGDKLPTKKQWARIKERIAQVDDTPLSPYLVHQYWPWNTIYSHSRPIWYGDSLTGQTVTSATLTTSANNVQWLNDIGRHEASMELTQ